MTLRMSLVAASAFCLVACGKVTESAPEKVIESKLSKDGTQAKVDLSGGGLKMTSTDASGKTTQIDVGMAKVSEAGIGLSFYPGTQPREGREGRSEGQRHPDHGESSRADIDRSIAADANAAPAACAAPAAGRSAHAG